VQLDMTTTRAHFDSSRRMNTILQQQTQFDGKVAGAARGS
jgi:hypothetical protein